MKFLVISDTHGNYIHALKAHTLAEPVDAIIHLGDGLEDANVLRTLLHLDVIAVPGNCDHTEAAPREMILECEGKRILLVHGDAYWVKKGMVRLEQRAVEVRADAVLFGHSHHATCVTSSGILFLNPGALIHTSSCKSFATLEVSQERIEARLYDLPDT